jgi:glucuronoarabinoxylan endo-1,4-beta-xylanase
MNHRLPHAAGWLAVLASAYALIGPGSVLASTCNIDFTQPQQPIDGFGASTAWYIGLAHNAARQDQQTILDTLLSPTLGIGLSIVRNRIPPQIEPSQGNFDWTQDGDAVWFMQQAQAYGVNRFISTPWTPPIWMKQTPDPNAYVELQPGMWQAFADFLSTYVLQYKARFGIDIYGVALANEPDWNAQTYECSEWDANEIHDFLLDNLIPTFSDNAVPAKLTAPESFAFREDLVVPTLSDPLTRGRVDIVSVHNYYDPGTPFTLTTEYGKPIWITEDSSSNSEDPSITDGLNWAQVYAYYLTQRNVSAYCFWWLVGPGGGQGALVDQLPDGSFQYNKRLYTLGNFSRFVRPGAVRVAADYNPAAGIYVAAFQSGADYVVVAINSGTQDTAQSFSVNGFTGSAMTPYRTSASENLAQLGAISVGSGQFMATLLAQSVTTFVGQATPFAVVSAAAYTKPALAAEEWAAVFGTGLATQTSVVTSLPLPTNLAGVQVSVQDNTGTSRPAPLLFVTPGQVNFLVPAGTALGPASITLSNGSSSFVSLMNVATVAPGIFSANSDGQGAPAAQAIAVSAEGTAAPPQPVYQCASAAGSCTPLPLDLGPPGSSLVLVLYGTGIRGVSSTSNVICNLGGLSVPVAYAGAQGTDIGLDQVNVALPRSLAGSGNVNVSLVVDGQSSNTVTINIK